MCKDCGCENALHEHEIHEHHGDHAHYHVHGTEGHSHSHSHEDGHQHQHEEVKASRLLDLEKKVLARNDEAADKSRSWLKERNIASLNFISSPGSGKTMLLERTLERLQGKVACGVIVGDQETDNDAKRLSGKGANVHQIETGNRCHLDAERVALHLEEVVGHGEKLLLIENVGNLICPAAFDLGEDRKVVLLSVTEGEDKPLKYPVVFSQAEVVILTKGDLVPHLDWNREQCLKNLRDICPQAKIFEVSAKTGDGMEAWVKYLIQAAAIS